MIMDDAMDLLKPILAAAEKANPAEEGDYYDDEGFLCCGKCHTRRQTLVEIPAIGNSPARSMKAMVMCECREERAKQEEEEARKRREMEAIASLKKQSLMDDRLVDAVFDNFEETDKNRKNLKACKWYADHFDQMLEKNQGLLFYGAVGVGKTFAAACIANELLRNRVPVVMTSFVKLLDTMQGFKEKDDELIARLNRAKLLVIDDLGAERSTDFALEKVYNIIDSRYRAKLPVILTTNLSMDDMKDAVDIRYARIYDRIFEMCFPMQFTGKSWRKTEATRRFNEMRSLMEDTE